MMSQQHNTVVVLTYVIGSIVSAVNDNFADSPSHLDD